MHVKHYDFLLSLSIHSLNSESLQYVSSLLFKSYLQTLVVKWQRGLGSRNGKGQKQLLVESLTKWSGVQISFTNRYEITTR